MEKWGKERLEVVKIKCGVLFYWFFCCSLCLSLLLVQWLTGSLVKGVRVRVRVGWGGVGESILQVYPYLFLSLQYLPPNSWVPFMETFTLKYRFEYVTTVFLSNSLMGWYYKYNDFL